MGDANGVETEDRSDSRLLPRSIGISNNQKKTKIINNNDSEGSKIPKTDGNGKVQSAVCDIVKNSKKDICQNNDDKSVINEEYLAVGRILSTGKNAEAKDSIREIHCNKHYHRKVVKPCLHVQFHKDEAGGQDGDLPDHHSSRYVPLKVGKERVEQCEGKTSGKLQGPTLEISQSSSGLLQVVCDSIRRSLIVH